MKKITASYRCTEIRATDDQGIVGRIPYNSFSEDIGFREILLPGCFSKVLQSGKNIMALWSHDDSKPLGSTKAGTLILNDTSQGLNVRILPNIKTSWGSNALAAVRRKDISGLSFGFTVKEDGIRWKNKNVREIYEIEQLFEISPVAFPAYAESCVRLRSSRCAAGQSLYRKNLIREMSKFFGVRPHVLPRKKQRELDDLRDFFWRQDLMRFFRRANLR